MFFFLVACTPTNNLPEVLDYVDAAAADIDALVEAHAADVAAATTTAEVDAAEATYAAAWADKSMVLGEALAMTDDCAMDDHDRESVDACMMAMDEMDMAVSAHTGTACAVLEDCQGAEGAHQTEMMSYTDSIRAAESEWDDGTMECAMGEMGDMGGM